MIRLFRRTYKPTVEATHAITIAEATTEFDAFIPRSVARCGLACVPRETPARHERNYGSNRGPVCAHTVLIVRRPNGSEAKLRGRSRVPATERRGGCSVRAVLARRESDVGRRAAGLRYRCCRRFSAGPKPGRGSFSEKLGCGRSHHYIMERTAASRAGVSGPRERCALAWRLRPYLFGLCSAPDVAVRTACLTPLEKPEERGACGAALGGRRSARAKLRARCCGEALSA